MTTETALLAAIHANPADDVPRKAFADCLRESGEDVRADFIEVQLEIAAGRQCGWAGGGTWECLEWNRVHRPGKPIVNYCEGCRRHDGLLRRSAELIAEHEVALLAGAPLFTVGWQANSTWVPEAEWEFRRGFVWKVEMPLRWWVGICPTCGGTGEDDNNWHEGDGCHECKDTGRVLGIGPQVVNRHPVETVRFTDKTPSTQARGFGWWGGSTATENDHDQLTDELWDIVADQPGCTTVRGYVLFASEEQANAAASTAAIEWARRQAAKESPA